MMMGDGGASGAGNTNQFIGSKISLISKSEIRYEGILYSLDLEEATISLQKVRSFGTEDRPTTRPVAPKDEVYEFIIFRGADIKGIDVLEPPPPSKEAGDEEPIDPAIVEVQHYQPQAPQQQPPQQPQQAQQPAPIGSLGMNDHRERFGNSFVGMGPPSGGNSMIGTPHHIGGQQSGIHQGFSLGVGFGNSSGIGGAVGQPVGVQQQQQQARPREVSSPPASNSEAQAKSVGSPPTPDQQAQQMKRNSTGSSNNNRRSYAPRGRGGGGDRGGQVNNSGGRGTYNQRGGSRGGNSYNNSYYGNRYSANGGQGPPRNYFRRGELKGNKKLTFDGEFDFEKANEELQKALMKIKIADGGKEDGEEDEVHHEDDRGSEDGEGSIDKENESKNFYQKDNFFDNISCEALERKSGKREKPDWRAERKLNAETFGLPLNSKPGMRGGGGSSTYYRGGGYHTHNYNSYNNYRGGYGGYSRGGGSSYHRGGGYRGGASRGGYANRSRGGGGSSGATVGSSKD